MRDVELPFVSHLQCVLCERRYAVNEQDYTCPDCGIAGILDVVFDLDRVRASGFGPDALRGNPDPNLWRYGPLLPVPEGAERPRLQVGMTPLYTFETLGRSLGLRSLLVKDDGRLPSGSFKDRASAVGTTLAKARGAPAITASSTGNAASSLACFSASLGIEAHIFVPARAPEAKVAQLLVFGAHVMVVEGSYDDAYGLCQEAAPALGFYNRNCAVNPYLVEGKKTCGMEIAEQVGLGHESEAPDWVAVSLGDGCTTAGLWKGLCHLHDLGILERLPRVLAVQAEGSDPITRAFEAGTETIEVQDAPTLADSIAVGAPRNAVKALRAVRASQGLVLSVSDEAILAAIPRLGAATGVFGEPAGVAALAGVLAAVERGEIGPDDRVLVVVTGNGLKDVKGALRAAGDPDRVPVDLDAVKRAVGAWSR